MKVVLKKRVPSVGNEWDIVTVKDGYAQNYLIPNKLAEPATPGLIKQAETLKKTRVEKAKEMEKDLESLAERLKGVQVTLKSKAKEDKLYGAVHEKEIIEAIKEVAKVELEPNMLEIKEAIKTTGEHEVTVKLGSKKATVKVIVEGEE